MPSVGKDLAAIRMHLGFSINDIQQSTRIPLDTLKSIESGAIFEYKDESKTYVRSFVRSYARAMKLDDEVVAKALDQQEYGNYNHLLLKSFPNISDEEIPSTPPPKVETKKEIEPESVASTLNTKESSDDQGAAPKPPAVRSVNWAAMGQQFRPVKKQTPVWLIGTIIILIILLASAYGVYRMDLFSSQEIDIAPGQETSPQVQTDQTGSDLSLDLTEEPPASAEAAELDDLLFITVYAAFDKLEPVRVWSDEKPREDPYWMDQGVAYNFEFRDSLRIRGQYNRMLLFLNGHEVQDFRNNYFNSEENAVELTRTIFEDDPKWATPVQLELPGNAQPPDSIMNRPQF